MNSKIQEYLEIKRAEKKQREEAAKYRLLADLGLTSGKKIYSDEYSAQTPFREMSFDTLGQVHYGKYFGYEQCEITDDEYAEILSYQEKDTPKQESSSSGLGIFLMLFGTIAIISSIILGAVNYDFAIAIGGIGAGVLIIAAGKALSFLNDISNKLNR